MHSSLAHTARAMLLAFVQILFFCTSVPAQDDFPLRPFFPGVDHISTQELNTIYQSAIIVDVRSVFENKVVRINKSTLIPWDKTFLNRLARLRSPKGITPIVVYCNDPTCIRAYRAAQAAARKGFNHVLVYDAGVFAWMNAYPDRSTLLGTTPAYPEAVLDEEIYEEHRLSYTPFVSKAFSATTQVVDIRDIYHRNLVPVIEGLRNIPLESFLEAITNRIWTEKTLLILDNDEKQTRWLQYFLEANGYLDYYFLAGGVEALPKLDGVLRPPRNRLGEITVEQNALAGLTRDGRIGSLARDLFLYLLSHLRFENYAIVSIEYVANRLDSTPKNIRMSAGALRQAGYLLFSTVDDTLITQVDPSIAWKGEMEGAVWGKRRQAFENATDENGGERWEAQ